MYFAASGAADLSLGRQQVANFAGSGSSSAQVRAERGQADPAAALLSCLLPKHAGESVHDCSRQYLADLQLSLMYKLMAK